ncbi:MAG TPA: IclR family transcriptional regulator C-terminal domain-containing protein [Rhizomicrobium sp.]|jgi:DNA-binding IclR family transcriptional regulator|nr:IclR family transcriptional regulator C-terminal domain-containing protein [Rhizomicrobium sp.]
MVETKPRGTAGRTPTGTQLLDKALDMVDLIEQSSHRLSTNAIALASGYPKPTVNRILSALVRRGFLAVDRRDQTYELGMRFTQMAATLRRTHRLVALVEDELIALSARTGESVSVGIPEPSAVRIVGRYQLGLESLPGGPTGAKRPYHASAIGKAILGGFDDRQMQKLVDRLDFARFTPRTLIDPTALLPELELVRARGYASDEGEIVEGVHCVAVPLFAMQGEICGAISLSAPAHRMPTGRVNEIVAALSAVAEKVSARLHMPRRNDRGAGGLACLRAGGLFHPIDLSADGGAIRVVDAGVPAVYTFSADGELRETLRLDQLPDAAALGPDGAIALARQGTVEFLAGDRRKKTVFKTPVTALAFAPGGRLLAITGGAMHDGLSGTRLFALDGDTRAFTVNGDRLYTLLGDMLGVRDLKDGKLLKRFPIRETIGSYGAIASDGRHVWISGPDTWRLSRIDMATGNETRLTAPERSVTALALGPDGLVLAGANLYASLIDKVEHNSGSLYRMRDPATG